MNKTSKRFSRRRRKFFRDMIIYTPVVRMTGVLIGLWILFSAGLYFSERGADGTSITSFGRALYWGIAAFSTAGIADMPVNGLSEAIGGLWIIVGSILFFGAIVATVTTYFMRPLQRPSKQIIDIIEFNLERLEDLTVEELEVLKQTTDALIDHMVRLRLKQTET
ncbi:MAG: two pore domain potassium channel family protein [Gammaproteobacteria bacterium]